MFPFLVPWCRRPRNLVNMCLQSHMHIFFDSIVVHWSTSTTQFHEPTYSCGPAGPLPTTLLLSICSEQRSSCMQLVAAVTVRLMSTMVAPLQAATTPWIPHTGACHGMEDGQHAWAAAVEGGMEVANEEVPRDKSDFVIRMERIQDWEMWQVSPQL